MQAGELDFTVLLHMLVFHTDVKGVAVHGGKLTRTLTDCPCSFAIFLYSMRMRSLGLHCCKNEENRCIIYNIACFYHKRHAQVCTWLYLMREAL